MSADPVIIAAPLSGWCMALREVPDAVFAQAMAGDGAAIDPVSDTVLAPCDGELVPLKDARHAVSVRHDSGIVVLVHVGIDTVALRGEGFELLVRAGERVKRGQALLRFDLDRVARRAPSLVTPVVISSGGEVVRRVVDRAIAAGDTLLEVRPAAAAVAAHEGAGELRREFRIPFEHGLHVRPAAQLVAALKPFAAEVAIEARGRRANGRSAVSMMALGVHCGDAVVVHARGADARQAVDALAGLLLPLDAPHLEMTQGAAATPFASGRIEALVANRGLAAGPAARMAPVYVEVEEASRGEAVESAALSKAIAEVDAHLHGAASGADGAQRAVLSAHAELLRDPELEGRARAALRRGASAGVAWREATRATAAMLASMPDPRMRERAADLRDLEAQVLRALAGGPQAEARFAPGCIVIAEELLPSQLAALQRGGAAGFCTARGGPTSHVAILASAAGMPALVAAGERVLAIPEGTWVALDAEHGWLDVAPAPAERAAFERAVAQRGAEHAADAAAAKLPVETRDGVRIVVHANLGALAEAAPAVEAGAEGCGLLRTEFLFYDRREAPGFEEQRDQYQAIARALGGRPLAIRTLDVGGDKPLAYLPLPPEENPALGMRGVRATLEHPQLLATQLAAIAQVTPAGACRVLVPMVNDVEELRRVRAMLEQAAREAGVPVPALGAMIETPAAALAAEALASEADFLSIGTNDLAQYTLAIDRGHARLGERLDALHPAVLRLIREVAQAAAARGKVACVCGALGSDVDALPLLIGVGIREISASPAAIARIKRTVRGLDAAECAALAARALTQTSAAAVRELAAMARARARSAAQSSLGGAP